jgi:hypothetical protein
MPKRGTNAPVAPEKEKLGVKIVIEITGNIKKEKLEEFVTGIRSTVFSNMENGGGG